MGVSCVSCRVKTSVSRTIHLADETGSFIKRERVCPLCGATSVTLEGDAAYIAAVARENYLIKCQEATSLLNVQGTDAPILVAHGTSSIIEPDEAGYLAGKPDAVGEVVPPIGGTAPSNHNTNDLLATIMGDLKEST